MRGFNRAVIMGNLTKDPEVKTIGENMPVCELRLAMNRQYTDRQGNQKEEVTYVDVDTFRAQAESCGKFLHRGSQVLVEGRLKMDSWEDRGTGKVVSKLKIVAELVHFLGGAPRAQGSNGGAGSATGNGGGNGNGQGNGSFAGRAQAPAGNQGNRPRQAQAQ